MFPSDKLAPTLLIKNVPLSKKSKKKTRKKIIAITCSNVASLHHTCHIKAKELFPTLMR